MDPISALVAIIAAGATSALKETAGQAVKDAYAGVKALLIPRLKSFAELDAEPAKEENRQKVVEEIKSTAANDDQEILDRIGQLQAALQARPAADLAKAGVSIEDLKAAGDILIKNVKYGRYFHVQGLNSATGKIDIGGLEGDNSSKK
ncbi:hypothetical protein [Rhizobium terrae]|uniref:hypothetical protein n=1 Tax=Rhizobium terrae TaxID=2171756 RepID=UPI000E3C4840|nr:hypothetical protein [Rhizobium terrae]